MVVMWSGRGGWFSCWRTLQVCGVQVVRRGVASMIENKKAL